MSGDHSAIEEELKLVCLCQETATAFTLDLLLGRHLYKGDTKKENFMQLWTNKYAMLTLSDHSF